MKYFYLILFFTTLLSKFGYSATYYVNDNSLINDIYTTAIGNNANTGLTPGDPFATLTFAISVAASGDVILIDAGNFSDINITIPVGLSNLTITGASISTTIFDGSAASGIFLFMDIRASNVLIENLTITEYDNAGAIDIFASSAADSTYVRFNDCYFYRNETFTSFDTNPNGGAVYISSTGGNLPAVVSFYNCQLGDNLSEQSAGGGAIYVNNRSRLYMYGSRMTCNNSRAILTTYEGGTIFFQNAYGELDSCFISGSKVIDQQGGAIRGINSSARLTINLKNTIFTENTGRQGAAVYMEDNLDCNIINSLIYANTVTGGFGNGGSISTAGAVNMYIANSTIADNLSTHASDGGGLADDGSSSYNVFNSIIWNNQVSNVRNASINATYCDIEPVNDNHSGVTGNITGNPLFNGVGDYTLQGTSPCINSGDLTGAPLTDLTNFTRVGNPDMGAFELGTSYPTTSTVCTLFLICNPPNVLALTADNTTICSGTGTNITIASSENGVYYQLVDDGTAANVGSPVPGNGGTISLSTGNLSANTDFSVTAYDPTFPSCISSLGPISIMVNAIPTVPSITTVSATCSADGSSSISNFSATDTYTFTPAGPSVDGTGNITGATLGTSYTITAGDGTCTSASSLSFTNDAMLTTPAVPTITTVASSCSADGSSSISNFSATDIYTFAPSGPSVDGTGNITGATLGTSYTITAGDGTCTSASSLSFTNDAMLTTPAVPTITSVAATCSADGSSSISNFSATDIYTFSPAGPSVDGTGNITGATLGTSYTITAGDGTCTSASSLSFTNDAMLTTPAVPTITVVAATCSADGSSSISNFSATDTYTFTPAGPSVDGTGNITGATLGTSYTITAGDGTCTSASSLSFTNDAMLTTPAVPTITSVAATCSADGSSSISNFSATDIYIFSPAGPSVDGTGNITGATLGTSYTITAGDGTCTSASSLSFTNDAMLVSPVVAVSSNTICEDGSLTLTPTSGGTWVSNAPSIASVTAGGVVTIATDGSVDFTFTSSNTCTATTSSVIVEPLPSITALTDISICDGDALVLTGNPSSGVSYAWSGPNSYTASSQSPTVSSNATTLLNGSYTLTIDDGSCSNSSSLNVIVNDLPVIDITNINSIDPTSCGGTDGSITGITATGAPVLSYEWNALGSQANADLTAGAGSYTLTVTDGNTCEAEVGPFSLSDPTPPAQPSITLNPSAVCVGGDFTISVDAPDPSATYAWTGPNGYTNTGTSISLTNNTASQAGNYTVTPTIGGCTGGTSIPVTVVVNSLPIVDVLTNNITIDCGNPYIYLDGSNSEQGINIIYTWTTPNGALLGAGTNDLDSTSTVGDYTLTVFNNTTGCEDNQTITVTGNATLPIAMVGGDITLDCSDLQPFFPITLDGTGSDTGVDISYSWNTTGSANITNGNTLFPDVDAAGTFDLTVTNTTNNCSATASITIVLDTVSPVIDISNTVNTIISCNSNLEATLDAGATTGNNTFSWTTSNGNIASQTGSSVVVDAAGDYTLTVLNADNNCSADLVVPVTIDTVSPIVSISNAGNLDCNLTPITLGTLVTNGSNETYLWNTTESTNSITINSAGNYTVVVTNDNGCSSASSTATVIINADPAPLASFTATPISGNVPLEVTYTNTSAGNSLTYNWDFGDGSSSTATDPINIFLQGGSFVTVLTVTDVGGCSDTASIVINVINDTPIIIPNVFSPNADGTNDLFSVTGGDIEAMEMTIFNRWGQLMFEQLFGNQIKWDGRTLAGVEVPEGTYYYIITIIGYDDARTDYTGYIQLIR